MELLILVSSLVTTLALLAGAFGDVPLHERLARYAAVPSRPSRLNQTAERTRSLLVGEFVPRLERKLPVAFLTKLREQLRQAGFFGAWPLPAYLLLQALSTLAGALAGLLLGGRFVLPAALALGGIGCLLPSLLLRSRVRARQAAIGAMLPDSIDLVTACVEAGLGLDASLGMLLKRRAKSMRMINQEFARYLQDLQLGLPRVEALRQLGKRSGVDDMRQVMSALAQGDALGIGVGQILRAQSTHLRLRRKQRAEEKAMKAPIKILFPLVFFIFPSIFVVILGPGVLRLMDTIFKLKP